MLKMIVATALLASAGVALASDASFDLKQIRNEKTATTDASAKKDAPSPSAKCTCAHARS